MSDEAAFLEALKANPADDTTRLVYADWLDEHDEPKKAAYLRLATELNCFPELDVASRAVERVRELDISTVWQAAAGPHFDLLLKNTPANIGDKIAAIKAIRATFSLGLGDSKLVTESPGAALLLNQPLPRIADEFDAATSAYPLALVVQPSYHPNRLAPQFLFRPTIAPWPFGLTDQDEDIELLIEIVTDFLGPSVADTIRAQRPGNRPVMFETPVPLGVIGRLSRLLGNRIAPQQFPYRHVQVRRLPS